MNPRGAERKEKILSEVICLKLLVVCQYYYPENFQITPICEQLAADGYEVTVLTGLPNYPTGIVPDEYKKGHRDEWINGVHVLRCFEYGRKKGVVGLALNYLSYCLSASFKIKEMSDDFDMVFIYQLSPILMGIPAIRYSNKHKKPLLLYCCDLWPESIKMYIKKENNPVFKLIKQISKQVYSSCDYIFTQSSSFISYLTKTHNVADDKISYLPAFADDKYLSEDFSLDNGIIDFVFLGNLGIAQNLICVLKAINQIKDIPGFKVHFVGDGSMLEEMKRFVKDNDMDSVVSFYGRRPIEEMPDFYKLADACLVSLDAKNETGLTLPAKVQGYMAAGKTILGMISGSTQEVVRDAQCGACVDSGDVDAFADTLKDFILNNSNYADCGENGRKYFVENFKKSIFMDKLKKKIDEVEKK